MSAELEVIAKDILKLKNQLGLRRPLVIEVCGTPKSGKTTAINALNIFLKRNGFNTSLVLEMAAVCPIKNKTDYFFNSWTFFSSIAETIKQLEQKNEKVDVIIVDRSIFDSLCWFEWLNTNPPRNPYLDDEQYKVFYEFIVGTPMWRSLFDITYILTTTPEKAMEREFASLITTKPGSIMNSSVLIGFNASIQSAKRKYQGKFKKMLELDTSVKDPPVVSLEMTTNVLNALKDLLTEKIGYFLKPLIVNDVRHGISLFEAISKKSLFFDQRSSVESTENIQPIVVAVITNKERDRVLVVKKNEERTEKGSPEAGRYLVYLGGHVRSEDVESYDSDILQVFRNTLRRELKEELNENLTANEVIPFLIYTPTNNKSKKHIAVCFIMEMDLHSKSFKPSQDEFVAKAGSTRSGHVVLISELMKDSENFEPWSEEILRHVFKVASLSDQQSLFKDEVKG